MADDATITGFLSSALSSSDPMPPHVDEVVRLYATLRKPLLRYALTFGIPASHVEELVQETFLALFRHLKACKPKDNLPGWLFRVCHNLAVDHRTKVRLEAALPETVDYSLNPEQTLLQTERSQRLQSVLRALPEQDRCCISLRAEGFRYREIANILGISLGSVSISLTRALAKFERADKE